MNHLSTLAAIAVILVPHAIAAQEVEAVAGLSVELNTTAPAQNGCTVSFVVRNGYDAPIDQAVFETVIFDSEGQVDRLTLFDFGDLPAGRTRVRQFTLSEISCDNIGQILVNGASTCEAPQLGEEACMDGLNLESRSDVELIG
ncbi:hypothetical protein [Palleronia sp. LCG004]|uniref:hypothetical protein n=1 Tax=Palleronia sp. LCG004 TaxID=3079304 RepID=UPI0029434DE4|nr:hypothetical protein [Palleronia sp. LCG004]WOI55000.1 hypothetical protein RVY76_07955 [Palleronia sp. LCG004]